MSLDDRLLMKEERGRLIQSMLHFREIMCSTKYTLEQKDNAFEDLSTDYLRTIYKTDGDRLLFEALMLEWEKRRLYECFGRKE